VLSARRVSEPAAGSAAQDCHQKIETLGGGGVRNSGHTYYPHAIGLGYFGKPGNYFARQVDR